MTETAALPLEGLRVVEVTLATSLVGAGLAGSLPGSLLRDFGAEVVRIQSTTSPDLDSGVEWHRPWNRGKEVLRVDDSGAERVISDRASRTDIIFLCGSEESFERRGVGYRELSRMNRRIIVGRIRPSYVSSGRIADAELLVHARSGLLTQFRGHRPGPAFCDVTVASAGAGLAVAAGVLGLLYERERTGQGGWVETSLFDGMLSVLQMIIGRVEHPSPSLESRWVRSDRTPPLSFRCRDGKYIQLWFGAKGAYEEFLDHIADHPSEAGYAHDMRSGVIQKRSDAWASIFSTEDRDSWVAKLSGHNFRCEPVLAPGECLGDPHVREIGLSLDLPDADFGDITVLGPVGRVRPLSNTKPPPGDGDATNAGDRLLSGVRVLDLSAYLAGPVTPVVLAEMGADVIKVEPPTGDVHRGVEFMYAAGQRGKRVVALDLKSPAASVALRRLFQWSDVVHHNSRIGLDQRLGYDEPTVRQSNPGVIYSHASGFGPHGPKALLPANDHLMQALCGQEMSAGGTGQGPTYLDWGAIDVTSGWVAACAILVGLYARRRTGQPQSVTTSLLGAGLSLKSGAFLAGATPVAGPLLDRHQTGYGAAYRIYQAGDGAWLALAVQDRRTWSRLRDVLGGDELPGEYPPLRTGRSNDTTVNDRAEKSLERIFRKDSSRSWLDALSAAGIPAELVAEPDRAEFVARILDDPVSLQLGRIVAFDWGPRGRLEQPGFPARIGPGSRPGAPRQIPELGEHTDEVLASLGFTIEERAAFASAGVTAGPLGRDVVERRKAPRP